MPNYKKFPHPDPSGIHPSAEQRVIMDSFYEGYHVKINSVAGSGKTTLILQLGRILAKKGQNGLIITYNRSLCNDTKKRVEKMGLSATMDVHTYHSACGLLYGLRGQVRRDIDMKNVVENSQLRCDMRSPLSKYDAIFIDEFQDMNPIYAELIKKILTVRETLQVVAVGDVRQCINYYNGSDTFYFNSIETFTPGREEKWRFHKMTTSYRLTPSVGKFVQRAFGTESSDTIVGGNMKSKDVLPIYYRTPISDCPSSRKLIDHIFLAIEEYGIDNVCIMAFTVTKFIPFNGFIEKLQMKLKDNQMDIHLKTSDADGSVECEKGKLLVCSFNAMKGREKEVCFVFIGLEADKYRDPREEPSTISNLCYVALTRARAELWVVEYGLMKTDSVTKRRYLDCSPVYPLTNDDVKLLTYVHPDAVELSNRGGEYTISRSKAVSVTESLNYRSIIDVIRMLNILEISDMNPYEETIDPKDVIYIDYKYKDRDGKSQKGKTNVMNYYGTALTYAVEILRHPNKKSFDSVTAGIQDYIEFMRKLGKKNSEIVISDFVDAEMIREVIPNIEEVVKKLKSKRSKSEIFIRRTPDIKEMDEEICEEIDELVDLDDEFKVKSNDFKRYCRLLIKITIRIQSPHSYALWQGSKPLGWIDIKFIKRSAILCSKFLNDEFVNHAKREKLILDAEGYKREGREWLDDVYKASRVLKKRKIDQDNIDDAMTTIAEHRLRMNKDEVYEKPCGRKYYNPHIPDMKYKELGFNKGELKHISVSSSSSRAWFKKRSGEKDTKCKEGHNSCLAVSPYLLESKYVGLSGRADLVTDRCIFEFKICIADEEEGLIQLGSYLALDILAGFSQCTCHIPSGFETICDKCKMSRSGIYYNLCTGTRKLVEIKREDAETLIKTLLANVPNWDSDAHEHFHEKEGEDLFSDLEDEENDYRD